MTDRRKPIQLLKPQHRAVLGLVAMAGAAFVLSVVFPRAPGPPPDTTASEPGVEGTDPAAAPDFADPPSALGDPQQLVFPRKPGATVDIPAALELRPRTPAGSVKAAMSEVLPGVNRCAADHAAEIGVDGQLRLRVTLGSKGIESAEIQDLVELPQAPTSCLSRALWSAPWPGFDQPHRVSFPFYVVPPLEGPAPTDTASP